MVNGAFVLKRGPVFVGEKCCADPAGVFKPEEITTCELECGHSGLHQRETPSGYKDMWSGMAKHALSEGKWAY